jgi:quercetin dioxygenase-like cupin family protein
MRKPSWTFAGAVTVTALIGTFSLPAFCADPPPGFTRKMLQDQNLSAKDRHAVVAQAEFTPGGMVGRHTHPGEELGYVLEGTVVLEVDGKPAQTLKAGDVYFIPAGVVHAAKNASSSAAKVLATYIVEQGKPVSTPVKE